MFFVEKTMQIIKNTSIHHYTCKMTHSLLSITFILSFLGLIGYKLIWIGRSVSGENMQKRELKVISKELELSLDTFILKWLKVKLFLKRITYWFHRTVKQLIWLEYLQYT